MSINERSQDNQIAANPPSKEELTQLMSEYQTERQAKAKNLYHELSQILFNPVTD